eukprot:519670-Rhodomonas_salina.2
MQSILQDQRLPQQGVSLTHKIVLTIENQLVPSIDLVDLPGMVSAHGGQLDEATKQLVEEHIEKNYSHSIYLLTCPASSGPNTSLAASMVLKKQLESRTVGVFTMCNEAAPRQLKLMVERLATDATEESGAVQLAPHGWVATMNAHILDVNSL